MQDPKSSVRKTQNKTVHADIAARLQEKGYTKATEDSVKAVHVRLVLKAMREMRHLYKSWSEDK